MIIKLAVILAVIAATTVPTHAQRYDQDGYEEPDGSYALRGRGGSTWSTPCYNCGGYGERGASPYPRYRYEERAPRRRDERDWRGYDHGRRSYY